MSEPPERTEDRYRLPEGVSRDDLGDRELATWEFLVDHPWSTAREVGRAVAYHRDDPIATPELSQLMEKLDCIERRKRDAPGKFYEYRVERDDDE